VVAVPAVDRKRAGVQDKGRWLSAGAWHGGFVQQGRHGTGHAIGQCVDKSTENDMTVYLGLPDACMVWQLRLQVGAHV
jgi:hypothetical protein